MRNLSQWCATVLAPIFCYVVSEGKNFRKQHIPVARSVAVSSTITMKRGIVEIDLNVISAAFILTMKKLVDVMAILKSV